MSWLPGRKTLLKGKYRARSTLKEGTDNLHISVLKNELSYPNDNLSPTNSDHPANHSFAQDRPIGFSQPHHDSDIAISAAYGFPQGSTQAPRDFVSGNNSCYPQHTHRASNQYNPQQSNNFQNTLVCYNCNLPGHIASTCPNRNASSSHFPRNHLANNRRSRNVTCHYCGIFGHVIRECRKRLRAESQQSLGQNQRFNQASSYSNQGISAPNNVAYSHHQQHTSYSRNVPINSQVNRPGNSQEAQSQQDARYNPHQYSSRSGYQASNNHFANNHRHASGQPSTFYPQQASTSNSQVPKN